MTLKGKISLKKTSIIYTCPIKASKHLVIIIILSFLVISHTTITFEQKFSNSPMSKYKTKIIPIIYITKIINTFKCNIR